MFDGLFHKEEELTLKRFLDMLELWRTRGITSKRYSGRKKLGLSITLYLERKSHKDENIILPPQITMYGGDAFAEIILVNGKLEFHYTEDMAEVRKNAVPLTEDRKVIMYITKVFNFYYEAFGLPDSLLKGSNKAVMIKEYIFHEFDAKEPPTLALDEDGDMYLFFEGFPPENGKITEEQAKNFIKLLSEISGISVYNEDVKTFIFEHADEKTFDKIVAFMKSLC